MSPLSQADLVINVRSYSSADGMLCFEIGQPAQTQRIPLTAVMAETSNQIQQALLQLGLQIDSTEAAQIQHRLRMAAYEVVPHAT